MYNTRAMRLQCALKIILMTSQPWLFVKVISLFHFADLPHFSITLTENLEVRYTFKCKMTYNILVL